jgi:hypothetical protein
MIDSGRGWVGVKAGQQYCSARRTNLVLKTYGVGTLYDKRKFVFGVDSEPKWLDAIEPGMGIWAESFHTLIVMDRMIS